MPEDLSAFVDFIENELDLDDDDAWDLPLVIANDWPEREQRIAEARRKRAAAYTPPRVRVTAPMVILFILMLLIGFWLDATLPSIPEMLSALSLDAPVTATALP